MTDKIHVNVFHINEDAAIPEYATEQSACFDIRANFKSVESVKGYSPLNHKTNLDVNVEGRSITIPAGFRCLIPTGLIFDIPEGYSLRLHPRSSFSLKKGLTLANAEGVIDSDYYHETFVAILNTSAVPVVIEHNDRVCQAEVVEVIQPHFGSLTEKPVQRTSRKGGFGSTGEK